MVFIFFILQPVQKTSQKHQNPQKLPNVPFSRGMKWLVISSTYTRFKLWVYVPRVLLRFGRACQSTCVDFVANVGHYLTSNTRYIAPYLTIRKARTNYNRHTPPVF